MADVAPVEHRLNDPVTEHMRTDLARLNVTQTVGEALHAIRAKPPVVVCILGGIAGGVTCAAVIGLSMPHVVHFFNREPQVAAGPIALASTDMVTLLAYFLLARWLLG